MLESLEAVRQSTTTADGMSQSAASLCERFGFRGPRARTLVKDLSGGKRLRELDAELRALRGERDALEETWLEASTIADA